MRFDDGSPEVPEVPTAVAAPRDGGALVARQLRAFFTEPPRFARNRFTWAASAAFVAAVLHTITLFGWTFCDYKLSSGYHQPAAFWDSVLIAIASLFLSLGLFPPLRLAAGLYYLLVRKIDPRWTAAWIIGTQLAAHFTVLGFLGLSLMTNVWVPIAVGALWGAWLPRVAPPEIA